VTIEAKIIEDSISPVRVRLTTFQLRYPRWIHAEFMTHRVFSRNASSSRAIPVKRIIADIENDPALFVHWGKNQKGMQAREEMDDLTIEAGKKIWLEMMEAVVNGAQTLNGMGFHKQIVNRALEPWSHISVVCTATDFDNFFHLRCHPDAQPEIKELSEKMADLYYSNLPRKVGFGQWHLPYIQDEERIAPGSRNVRGELKNEANLIKASVARCARVSYLTHDKQHPDLDLDVALHDRLLDSKHMSPFENVATPTTNPEEYIGNFRGWCQYRKMLKGEHCNNYIPLKKEDDG
jgi:thymidylate synthase ThyX